MRADLAFAAQALIRAEYASTSAEQFASAQLAALRVAAAVLTACAAPSTRAATQTAWDVLARRAPQYAEWADYFAATQVQLEARRRGIARPVSARQASDHVRAATDFYLCVERWSSDAVATQVMLAEQGRGSA